MTIDGKTICKLIQSFPVLLILAQKHEKCLKTPFIYKPPTPTHAPEYYEAYDALIQNLFGHDCYYNKKSLEKKPCHYPEHETPVYGHGSPTYAHEYPTYAHEYPSYGSEYPTYGPSYPTSGHAIYGHSDSSIYPVLSEGNQAFTRNGFRNNMTKYTYKSNYAPSQKHNVKRRVKIVVKSKGRKRSQKLKGFYPNDRRNRQPYQYGFSENILNPRRIQQKLSSLLSFQPETDNSNAAFIYPFNNRPISHNPYNNYDNNYYQSSNVRFPTSGDNFKPTYPGDNTFGPDYKEVPKQPNGQTLQGFTTNPSLGDDTQDEPITNRPILNYGTTQKINYNEVYKPGFSNHSSGLIMGSVLNKPVFGSFITPDSATNFDTSAKPSFEDRNGEEQTTLPTLTPVPPSDARQNMNFGPAGIFKNTCETVDGGVGNCIKIQECDVYYKLLRDSRDKTVVNILRKSQCGFEGQNPKVCCPLPGIPDEPPAPQTTTVAPTPQAKSVDTDGLTPVTSLPEPPVCGVSEASFSRVVNGVPAKLGDFPWMALLGYHDSRGGPETRWKCGGSLVTQHHVFTAAHCIHGHEDLLYVVRLGELDLASENDGAAPIDVLIKSKIKHENYDSSAYTNDVALLILDKDVQFTKLIKPICIPQNQKLRSLTFEKYNPLIAGWGDVSYRGPSASHLQVAQVPVVSNAACKETYKPYKKQVIDERVLCAGWKDGRQDACQGDSGGPLMQPIWNSETYETFFYQIGIVSFGNKCAEPGFPGVYTRVTHFVPWLEKKIIGS